MGQNQGMAEKACGMRRGKEMNIGKVIACLKELNFRPRIDSFEHRLLIQKTVYLLQLKALKSGFEYNLYARGPYSPELTDEIYSHKNSMESLQTSEKLQAGELKAIQEFSEIFELSPSILEIASTYALFAFQRKEDPITALKNVKRIKQFYSDAQIAAGVSKAKEFLFEPLGKEIFEMKQEAKAWQEASLKAMRD